MVQILLVQMPSRRQKRSLSRTRTYHSSRQENFSFQPSVYFSYLAAISCAYPLLFFLTKKSGEIYQSVKFNAQNFSLIGVAAHGWKNIKSGPYNPKTTGTLILILSINNTPLPFKAFGKPVSIKQSKITKKFETEYSSFLLTGCWHIYSSMTQYVVNIIILYWYI